MKLSDYVMKFIFEKNVKYIFGYQGGSIAHLIDSLHKVEGLTYIQNYHEQASSFSADAYARASAGIGVAIATSGPGATNLITGIANAYFDSVPCLFITGQVSTHLIKTNDAIRQQSFQETDIVSIVKPITKFAETILAPEKIRFYLEKAVFWAQSGRPGAVLLDIPHNVQASEIDPQTLESFFDSDEYKSEEVKHSRLDQETVRQIVAMLTEAKRPVVLAGGGMSSVRGTDLLKTFVHTYDLPVVGSLMGLDVLDHNDEHFCGFIGSYGNRYANFAVAKSDLLLVLGSRLDERQTGSNRTLFAKGARIIHVDIDPHELNHHFPAAVPVCSDVGLFLKTLTAEIGDRSFNNRVWLESIHRWKVKYPSYLTHEPNIDFVDPNEFLHVLSTQVSNKATVCLDVGQNQMWVAQSFFLSGDKRFLSSSGHGAMGYSLPAGIGAHFAAPDRQTICIMGDGGVQMNLQELQTVYRENIPLKIFVMNNQSLGLIRDLHENYSYKNIGSVEGYTNPDFKKIANAFKIAYTKISSPRDFEKLDRGLKTRKPHFFEVMLSPHSQVIPGPAPRRAVEDQLPLLDRDEYNQIFEL
ncbi:MAG: thiamine pyrophosphate-binding protein [Chloroflexi bacterium]|nr:thiamine pyrophosphate-binding protein [Chloroflexota bacterium]